MPRLDYKNCRECGKSGTEVGALSWTRLCRGCAETNFAANLDQLKAHEGPYFQRHRRACVAAFGGVLLDDMRAET